jgi:hypothetical protein
LFVHSLLFLCLFFTSWCTSNSKTNIVSIEIEIRFSFSYSLFSFLFQRMSGKWGHVIGKEGCISYLSNSNFRLCCLHNSPILNPSAWKGWK